MSSLANLPMGGLGPTPPPTTLTGMLAAKGLNPATATLAQALNAFGVANNQSVLSYLQTHGMPLTQRFAQVQKQLGLSGNETLDQAWNIMSPQPTQPSAYPDYYNTLPVSLSPSSASSGVTGPQNTAKGYIDPATGKVLQVGDPGFPTPASQNTISFKASPYPLPVTDPAATKYAGIGPKGTPITVPMGGPPAPVVPLSSLPAGHSQPTYPSPGQGPAGTTSPVTPPPSLIQLLTQSGFDLTTPIGQTLSAFNADPKTAAILQSKGIDLNSPIGDVMKAMGLTGQEPLSAATSKLDTMSAIAMPPVGQFPQAPAITLPKGLEPQPFQAPAPPNLPSSVTLPPELQQLMGSLQSQFTAQQGQRDALLQSLQQGIAQQQANANANQPMLDAALANIQSVLTGQPMSQGVQGLVNSAFAPAENEGQIRLRQAAEEAAAARGMHLTDTPIGQPYMDESRRFLEQMGGQRAQAAIGIRQQDAAFSEQVRQFQEGLKQQALTNQTDVLKTLGTPEQAASVLSNLGLGARNAAVQQYGIQSQQALGASDQALRAALGQASTNQANSQLALAAQGQGFNQQLAQQQASIQNQLALLGAMGDPYSAYTSGSQVGSTLTQQQLNQYLNLSAGLLGTSPSWNISGISAGGGGSTLGGLGQLGMGAGNLLSGLKDVGIIK